MDGSKSYYPHFRVIQKHGNLNRAVIRSKISYMHRFWIFLLTFPQNIFRKPCSTHSYSMALENGRDINRISSAGYLAASNLPNGF